MFARLVSSMRPRVSEFLSSSKARVSSFAHNVRAHTSKRDIWRGFLAGSSLIMSASAFIGSQLVEPMPSVECQKRDSGIGSEEMKTTKKFHFYKASVVANMGDDFYIISGSGNPILAEQVCKYLGQPVTINVVGEFNDGEVNIRIKDSVRGKKVYIIQPVSKPVNDNLAELLLLISCARRANAETVTAVIPYFGYSRQSQRLGKRVPIASADVATMLTEAGADRIISIDLHHNQLQGYFPFSTTVDCLSAVKVGAVFYAEMNLANRVTVVAGDADMVPKTKKFLEVLLAHGYLDAELAVVIDDNRHSTDMGGQYIKPQMWKRNDFEVVGDVSDRDCILVSDIIDSAKSAANSAKELKARGAKRVFAFMTHGLFNGDAVQTILNADLDGIVVTNTTPVSEEVLATGKVTVITIAPLLAETIRRVHFNKIGADKILTP